MLYVDEHKLRERYLAYWNRENHDRPLMSVTAPGARRSGPPIPRPDSLKKAWTDVDYIVKCARRQAGQLYYAGEAFPLYCPNLGPDLVGAICGCELVFGEDTSWARPSVAGWESLPPITFNPQNPYFVKIMEITRAVLRDSRGDYLVGVTDLHPGSDALVSLRGAEAACIDLVENAPELVRRSDEIFEVYRRVYTALDEEIRAVQQGSTCWMGILNPTRGWYPVSSDFSCMISPADYEYLVAPAIEREIDFLGAAIYHLDGPDALRHLDRILAMERLNGVQWVYGAGQPSARHWIHVLKKIQRAGKLIEITAEPEDVETLCSQLRPEGVHITVSAASPEQADELIKIALRATRDAR